MLLPLHPLFTSRCRISKLHSCKERSATTITQAKVETTEPEKQYVVVLYDLEAWADGDSGFKAGNHIQIAQRTPSTEDWWMGQLNGRERVLLGVISCPPFDNVCFANPSVYFVK
jgi:hypothetical protein